VSHNPINIFHYYMLNKTLKKCWQREMLTSWLDHWTKTTIAHNKIKIKLNMKNLKSWQIFIKNSARGDSVLGCGAQWSWTPLRASGGEKSTPWPRRCLFPWEWTPCQLWMPGQLARGLCLGKEQSLPFLPFPGVTMQVSPARQPGPSIQCLTWRRQNFH
jgi:hypothetical protein